MANLIPKQIYSVLDLAFIFTTSLILPLSLMYYSGLLKGALRFACMWALKQFVIRFMMQLEPLTTIDEFFLLDWTKNRANIITLMKISKVTDYN